MMKVVQINATYGAGSTGALARDIHLQLKAQGHESYVFWATACRGDVDGNVLRIGSAADHKGHALLRRIDGGQGFHSRAATRALCQRLDKISPDAVHLHNLHSNYIHLPILLSYLAKRKIPTVLTLHDCWFFTGHCMHHREYGCALWQSGCADCPAVPAWQKRLVQGRYTKKQKGFGALDRLAVCGVSRWTAEEAGQAFLSQAEICTHVYNWLDADTYVPKATRAEVCEKYGLDVSKKIVLGVAQAWSAGNTKGADEFCQMAERFRDVAEVVLVGKNEGVPEIKGLHLLGYTANRQELVDLYAAADLLANPSRFETFGLVTVEAMACGTPVVAYNNTGSAELVTDEVGALVADGDATALMTKVAELLEKGKDAYRDACIRYVRENFAKHTQINKYVDIYRQLTEPRTKE